MIKHPSLLMFKPILFLLLTPMLALAQAKNVESKFELSSKESQMLWKCENHEGTLQLASGFIVTAADGKPKSGSFVIDMTSIASADRKKESKKDELAEHLKSDDFFSVTRYPKAYFVCTKIVPTAKANEFTVTGNLTIKGVSNPISFLAVITTDKRIAAQQIAAQQIAAQEQMVAKGETTINRTFWGINYKANMPTFLGPIVNNFISNDIKISLNLVFNKVSLP